MVNCKPIFIYYCEISEYVVLYHLNLMKNKIQNLEKKDTFIKVFKKKCYDLAI
jgi:hypothetical protein